MTTWMKIWGGAKKRKPKADAESKDKAVCPASGIYAMHGKPVPS